MRVRETLDKFKDAKVLVLGDLILDRYLIGPASRLSPEAPVPVVELKTEKFILGGSLNVANNLRELGAAVFPCGIVGRDDNADRLIAMVEAVKMDSTGIIKDGPTRPTTVKTRVISGGHHIVRIDRESTEPITMHERIKLVGAIRYMAEEGLSAIILSDYAKGVLSCDLIEKVLAVSNEYNIPVIVDPKKTNFSAYKGVEIITPNKKEAYAAVKANSDVPTETVARDLLALTQAKHVLITLGEEGMLLTSTKHGFCYIETVAQEVVDVSGAGDTVVAAIALGLSAGLDIETACRIANVAAGIVVGKSGTAVVTRQELSRGIRKRQIL